MQAERIAESVSRSRQRIAESINFSIRCEDSSSTSNSSSKSRAAPPSNKTSTSTAGLGFGSTSGTIPVASKKKQQVKKERASITRRAPFAKPDFASQKEDIESKERGQNECDFLLDWFGLGTIIILEGLVLAALVMEEIKEGIVTADSDLAIASSSNATEP